MKEFYENWKNNFSKSYPISSELREQYSERWFRIHSLPNSKRYAKSDDEYKEILRRQNVLISDLFGECSEINYLCGVYDTKLSGKQTLTLNEVGKFIKIKTIQLHKMKPREYEDECFYNIYLYKDKWEIGSKDLLLKKIADDELRVMFIDMLKKRIIAPYDGGVDVFVESEEKRDELKAKYKKWLSNREDFM